jgi:hypothetical protein
LWCTPAHRITNGNCSPPCSGGSGSAKYRSGYALYGILLHHILPALVFASQSPYSGWQNVSYLERYTTIFLPQIIRRSVPSMARGLYSFYDLRIRKEEE